MRIENDNLEIAKVFAMIFIGIPAVIFTGFYALVGVVCLHATQPDPMSLGDCIQEAGTMWCKMEKL